MSQELRVTLVLASHLTSRVSSTGLVIELGPIDSPVIIRQILGGRSGPRSEREVQPTCQDQQETGLCTGLPPASSSRPGG